MSKAVDRLLVELDDLRIELEHVKAMNRLLIAELFETENRGESTDD